MAFIIPYLIALGAANLGANLMQLQEDTRAEERAREAADREQRAREAQIAEQAREAERAADVARQAEQRRIQHEREQLGIIKSIIDFCKSGHVYYIPACLKQLDDPYFNSLGLKLLYAAKDDEARYAIDEMLNNERNRRQGLG